MNKVIIKIDLFKLEYEFKSWLELREVCSERWEGLYEEEKDTLTEMEWQKLKGYLLKQSN